MSATTMNLYDEQRKRFEEMKAQSLDSLQHFVDFHLDEREKIRGGSQQYFGTCAELTALRSKQKDRIDSLGEERLELEENIKDAIRNLDSQRSDIKKLILKSTQGSARITALQLQVNQVTGLVDSSLREKDSQQAFANQMETKFLHDSIQCEKFLGLDVTSIDANLVRFSFTNIDPNDFVRQFIADIDFGLPSYILVNTTPNLPREIVLSLEKELNNTQNMKLFLRSLRSEFKKLT